MSSHNSIRGVVPILPTPFTGDDEVDYRSLEPLVDFAILSKVAAVGTPAFGSEFYKLDGVERSGILETVIGHAAGRVPVIAQCNHHSPRKAAAMASDAQNMGANAINVALPRNFASSPRELMDYARAVCDAVDLPVVIQDWNPGGETVGAAFVVELHRQCPNFRYLKREDAGIGPVIREISKETGGAVGVFLGWGGMHMLELHRAGACGIMPGLALADIFVRIWQLADDTQLSEAYQLFCQIAPYLQFSLNTFEFFHHAEKRLLQSRGILDSASVRSVTVTPNDDMNSYLDLHIAQLQALSTEHREVA